MISCKFRYLHIYVWHDLINDSLRNQICFINNHETKSKIVKGSNHDAFLLKPMTHITWQFSNKFKINRYNLFKDGTKNYLYIHKKTVMGLRLHVENLKIKYCKARVCSCYYRYTEQGINFEYIACQFYRFYSFYYTHRVCWILLKIFKVL